MLFPDTFAGWANGATWKGITMTRLIVLLAALLIVGGGCDSKPGSTGITRTTAVTEAEAIDIARQAVSDNDGWDLSAATIKATPTGNGWAIVVAASNRTVEIMIDGDGNMVNYEVD